MVGWVVDVVEYQRRLRHYAIELTLQGVPFACSVSDFG